jgi:hypothetical protein
MSKPGVLPRLEEYFKHPGNHRGSAMNDQKLMTMRILWAALLTGTVMFLVVGYIVTSQRSPVPQPEPSLLAVLGVTAIGLAVGSVTLPPFLLRQALRSLDLTISDAPSPGPSNTRRRARRFLDPAAARLALISRAQAPFIVGMALAEAVALHGFVLWFLEFELTLVLPFFVACWGLMLSKFPRVTALEHQLESIYDADLR